MRIGGEQRHRRRSIVAQVELPDRAALVGRIDSICQAIAHLPLLPAGRLVPDSTASIMRMVGVLPATISTTNRTALPLLLS
ncbi:hypothetical protein G6F32_017220 [Rhizopus arrhizus]|nr:hypothetical protein G6F32_017220 [Rhizopus arrhizus]